MDAVFVDMLLVFAEWATATVEDELSVASAAVESLLLVVSSALVVELVVFSAVAAPSVAFSGSGSSAKRSALK